MPWPARVGVVAAAFAVSAGTATGVARAADPFGIASAVDGLGAQIRQEVHAKVNETFSRAPTGVDASADAADQAADAAPIAAPDAPAAVNGENTAPSAVSQPRPKGRHAVPPQSQRPAPREAIRVVAHSSVRSSAAYSASSSKVAISLRARDYVPRPPPPRRPRTVAPKAPQQPLPTPSSSDASAAAQGGHGSGFSILFLLAALAGGLLVYGMRHLLPPIPEGGIRTPRRSALRPWRPG